MKRIANYEAPDCVRNLQEFEGRSVFARWIDKTTGNYTERMYVVYSYGRHWPMHLYHEPTDTWYENRDKYSRTTSKHHSQTRPRTARLTTQVSVSELKEFVHQGVDGCAVARLRRAHNSYV